MAKMLNIDELVPVEKVVNIKGTEYPVADRTVEQVLQMLKGQKELEKGTDYDEATRVELFLDMVSSAIPDCPKEVLRNLPVRALNLILEYVNATEEVEDEESGK